MLIVFTPFTRPDGKLVIDVYVMFHHVRRHGVRHVRRIRIIAHFFSQN
jgi:hypothetical protein